MSVRQLKPLNMAIAMRDDETRRAIEARLSGRPRHVTIGAMPSARAGHASHRTALRRFGQSVTIAIAVFCIVYFGLQMLRGVL